MTMTAESDLKKMLERRVFGPDDAVSAAIKRRRAGLHQPEKAIRMISMGPTRVGKSEMPNPFDPEASDEPVT